MYVGHISYQGSVSLTRSVADGVAGSGRCEVGPTKLWEVVGGNDLSTMVGGWRLAPKTSGRWAVETPAAPLLRLHRANTTRRQDFHWNSPLGNSKRNVYTVFCFTHFGVMASLHYNLPLLKL